MDGVRDHHIVEAVWHMSNSQIVSMVGWTRLPHRTRMSMDTRMEDRTNVYSATAGSSFGEAGKGSSLARVNSCHIQSWDICWLLAIVGDHENMKNEEYFMKNMPICSALIKIYTICASYGSRRRQQRRNATATNALASGSCMYCADGQRRGVAEIAIAIAATHVFMVARRCWRGGRRCNGGAECGNDMAVASSACVKRWRKLADESVPEIGRTGEASTKVWSQTEQTA